MPPAAQHFNPLQYGGVDRQPTHRGIDDAGHAIDQIVAVVHGEAADRELVVAKLRAVLVTPVVCASASSSVVRLRSSSCWRVITLTDCGVWRMLCPSLPRLSSRAV
jgi:hypothetical protein